MQTTALISMYYYELGGSYKSMSVDYNGYIEWTGRILLKYYKSRTDIELLLSCGNLTSLEESIAQEQMWPFRPTWTGKAIYLTENPYVYQYLWKFGDWYVWHQNNRTNMKPRFRLLKDRHKAQGEPTFA